MEMEQRENKDKDVSKVIQNFSGVNEKIIQKKTLICVKTISQLVLPCP